MFADYIKIAVKMGACLGIVAAFVAGISIVHIPALDYSLFTTAIGKGYAIMTHWVPAFPAIYGFAVVVLDLWLALWTFQLTIFVYRILLKVNG